MSRRIRTLMNLLSVAAITTPALGQTAGMLSFQGLIKDTAGNPINGPVTLEFRIVDAETGGQVVAGPFGPSTTPVIGGIVNSSFGPVSPESFDGARRWLEVSVEGNPLNRIELSSAPASAEQLSRGGTTVLTVHADRDAVESLEQLLVTRDHAPGVAADQIVVRSRSDQDKQLLIGYDVENNVGSLQAVEQNVAFRSIVINPKGGAVGIGTSPWPNGRLDVQGRVYADEVAFYRPTGGLYGITTETNALRISGYNTRFYNNGRHTLTLSLDGNAYFPGHVHSSVLHITGGSDLAEPFEVNGSSIACHPIEPGMVVTIDPEQPGKLRLASEAYDKRVAGVISGANGLSPGMIMKAEGTPHADGEYPVALTGRVYVWADASHGAIEPGDRLTTSPTHGHAMKVGDDVRAVGAVIGKAMTPLHEGKGLVLVLVNLQ